MGFTKRVTFEPRREGVSSVKSWTIKIITSTSTCLGLPPFGKKPYKVLTLEFRQQSQILLAKATHDEKKKKKKLTFPQIHSLLLSTPKYPNKFFLICKYRNLRGMEFFT